MAPTAQYGSLPFPEAIEYLRDKVNLPTERYTDLMGEMHSRAFVVAGAQKAELLEDFHRMIDKAIAGELSFGEFQKGFDKAVEKHGWAYRGGRGWRTDTIYYTNLSTAYTAGREKQMAEPVVRQAFPMARYRTMGDSSVRPKHQEWNDTVLPWDDPWWDTHSPPGGWGCRCWKEPASQSTIEGLRSSGQGTFEAPRDGTYTWRNPSTGRVQEIPVGIDPGWDYHPGKAAWGQSVTKRLADEAEASWTPIDPWGPQRYGRGEVPIDKPRASVYDEVHTEQALRDAFRRAVGGDIGYFTNPAGDTVCFNQGIVDHILEAPEKRWNGRERYFGFLPEIVEDPYEIWLAFERNDRSGKVRLRQRYVKMVQTGKTKSLGLVCDVVHGMSVGLTMFSGRKTNLKNLRVGRLQWARE